MSAAVTPLRTPAETAIEGYLERPQSGLAAEREAARAAFRKLGLPHRRIEAWHYTDLRALLRTVAAPAPEPQQAPASGPSTLVGASPLTFADGWLGRAAPALPEGVAQTTSAISRRGRRSTSLPSPWRSSTSP